MLTEFKAKTMDMRKAKDKNATFMVTVLSKANMMAKDETKNGAEAVTTDDHMLRAINSFMKGINETIDILKDKGDTTRYAEAVEQRELLAAFLPAQVSREDIEVEIKNYLADNPITEPKKAFGVIMGHLNTKFGASLNKKEASELIKAFVA